VNGVARNRTLGRARSKKPSEGSRWRGYVLRPIRDARAQTRGYISNFELLARQTTTPRELCDQMLKRYPDWVNPSALWTSVRAVKTKSASASGQGHPTASSFRRESAKRVATSSCAARDSSSPRRRQIRSRYTGAILNLSSLTSPRMTKTVTTWASARLCWVTTSGIEFVLFLPPQRFAFDRAV
jgi:hypothetical protein